MPNRTYDVIVIGAGPNGLTCAAYLQRAGLSTLVIERRHEEGGGASTEEPMLPGHRHNLHANFILFNDLMPMYRDFDLPRLGLRHVMPEAQVGIAFADGRPPIVLHRPDLLDKTHASIAQYSKTDADTYVEFKKRGVALEPLIGAVLYNPPVPETEMIGTGEGIQDLVESIYGDMGISGDWVFKSVKTVIDELFETDELRAMWYQYTSTWAFDVDTDCAAGGFLMYQGWMTANGRLTLGGTHSFAKAMTQACYAEGVDLLENTLVEQVLVENGRAVGVRVRGGEEIFARKAVCSGADIQQTLLQLVGEEELSPTTARRAKNYRFSRAHCWGTTMWDLYEPPAYESARWDPEINRTWFTVVGCETAEQAYRQLRDGTTGRLADPASGMVVNSLWDPSQAPPGRHSAHGYFHLPNASSLTREEWADVRATYNDEFLRRWRESAPNMTSDNVLAHRLQTPDEVDRKFLMLEGDWSGGGFSPDQLGVNRPFPEAANYRLEPEGLYLCGASAHPGGGLHGACGYNAAKAVAEDLDLDLKLPEPDSEDGRLY